MASHKQHRNMLYTLFAFLALIQLMSFVFMSITISKLDSKIESESGKARDSATKFTQELVSSYDSTYQENFIDLSKLITQQAKSFEQEIKLLQSTREDFSDVVKESVKAVVTVSTGSSVASGFFVHPSGYLLTNYHVIKDNDGEMQVVTHDRKTYSARLVGKDENKDLALLKVDGIFPFLELADSEELEVGNKVIAIGNPLGLSFTVTEGIVSGLNREGPNNLPEYVQTDVSLNPGNSGGPLIDINGKVVGINNFKIGGAESLGFSLESNAMKKSVNEMAGQELLV